ncbi:hypothetical protein TNCV_3341021 [Trichonephila clavipes]|nr:hypothetical protein TNCV_3341021 [Trichonephila clavipes]
MNEFLGVYLHRFGLGADEASQIMPKPCQVNGDYLLQCTGLDEYLTDDVISWHLEARRQMFKKQSKEWWINRINMNNF